MRWHAGTTGAGSARHVGRVGALAVALGVGVAVAMGQGPGVGIARADEQAGSTEDSTSTGATPTGGGVQTPGPAAQDPAADSEEDAAPIDDTEDDAGSTDDAGEGEASGATDPSEETGADVEPSTEPEAVADADVVTESASADGTAVKSGGGADTTAEEGPDSQPEMDSTARTAPTADTGPDAESPPDETDPPTETAADATPSEQTVPEAANQYVSDAVSQTITVTQPKAPVNPFTNLVNIATRFMQAIFTPFATPADDTPIEPPWLAALLAWVRRQSQLAQNRAPVAVNDAASLVEDTARVFTAAELLGNDTDRNTGDTLSVGSVGGATHGSVVLNSDGTVTFTPDTNYHGAASFTYRPKDALGKTSARTATVSLTVTPVDDVVFRFDYGTGAQYWTPEAKAGLQAAADRMSDYIATATPVTITYNVTAEMSTTTGYVAYANSPWGTWADEGYWSTVVHEKILSENHFDANGAAADGNLHFNLQRPWEFGDNLGWDELDFQSVVLHEMAHTMGFVSNVAGVGENTKEYWYAFDEFIVDANGTKVIGDDFRWDTAFDANLTGANGGLYFGGPTAVAVYGGPVPLRTGSLSHLNGSVFNSLMAENVLRGQALWTFTPVELAILMDLGYTVV